MTSENQKTNQKKRGTKFNFLYDTMRVCLESQFVLTHYLKKIQKNYYFRNLKLKLRIIFNYSLNVKEVYAQCLKGKSCLSVVFIIFLICMKKKKLNQ